MKPRRCGGFHEPFRTSQGHQQAARLLEPISWPQARYHYLRALALDKTNSELIRQFAGALQAHEDHKGAAKMRRWLQSLTRMALP